MACKANYLPAQGNALGEMPLRTAPCKGKIIVWQYLLPSQGGTYRPLCIIFFSSSAATASYCSSLSAQKMYTARLRYEMPM